MMVKLDQILSHRGEGSSHVGISLNQGKQAEEDLVGVPNSLEILLESKATKPQRVWVRADNIQN